MDARRGKRRGKRPEIFFGEKQKNVVLSGKRGVDGRRVLDDQKGKRGWERPFRTIRYWGIQSIEAQDLEIRAEDIKLLDVQTFRSDRCGMIGS